jgi:hypothetical protein
MEAESMCEMSISQFAKEVGVSVETIRFYERRGLVQPASRKANGYRVYGPDEVRRVRLILAGTTADRIVASLRGSDVLNTIQNSREIG